MATVTQLITTPDSSNTPNATGSFTPTEGDLLVVVTVTSASVTDADDVPTASANGITFSSSAHFGSVYNASTNSLDIFIADQLVPASPASMTITWGPTDAGTSSNTAVYAVRSYGGRVGADAFAGGVANTNGGTGGQPPTLTFGSGTVDTNNLTILAVGNLSAPAGQGPPTGWTEVTDTNCTTPTAGVEVCYRDTGYTGGALQWNSNSATAWGTVGIEIDTSAAVTNYNGSASRAETFTVTATGRADHSSGASRSLTDTITATGSVGKRTGAAVALGFGITATGSVGTGGITIRQQIDTASNTSAASFTLSSAQVGDTVVVIHADDYHDVSGLLTPGGTAVSSWGTVKHTLDGGTNDNHAKVWVGTVTTAGGTVTEGTSTTDQERYFGVWVLAGAVDFDTAASTDSDTTSNSHVAPSVTPTSGKTDDLLICLWGLSPGAFSGDVTDYTIPGGMTARTERDIEYTTFRAADEHLTSDAATGTRTAASSSNRAWFAVSVLMKTPTRVAPTRVAYAEVANWHSDTTPRSTASVSWQTGDEVYVLGMTASASATLGTPTATGLTFNAVGTNPTGGSNACNGYAWKAVAASNGSGAISGSRTADFGEWGIAVWVMRGTDGTGTKATNVSTAKTVSTTRTADKSRVIEIIGDWSAAAVTGYSWTPAGATDDEASSGDGTQYSIYVADWPDQGAAGTTSYGITGTSSTGQHTKIAIEVKGTGASGAYTGTASRAQTFGVTAAGAVGKATGTSRSQTFAVTATGRADHGSGASRAQTFGVTTAGVVGKRTGTSVPLAFSVTAAGVVGKASGTSVPLTDTITAAGRVGKQTGASLPLAFAVTATGSVTAQGLSGTASLGLTDTITATGRADHAASTSVPLSLAITSSGVVGKRAGTSVPLAFAVTATGQVFSPVTRVAVTASATNTPLIAAFSPTLPTHISGDRLTLFVVGKYNTTTVPTIDQGWTTVENGTGGTGTTGADVGQTFWVVYQKDATSGSETAPTVTPGATVPNSWEWFCVSHRPGAGMQWADTIASGGVGYVVSASDTTTGSPLTGTTDAFSPQVTSGDAIFTVGVIPTDLGTALGTTTVTETGLSGGTLDATSTNYTENNTGADTAAVWAGWTGFTGTGSAGLAVSFTVTGATNQSGSIVGVAFRQEVAVTNYNGSAARAETVTITATGRADHAIGASRAETFTVTATGTATGSAGTSRPETITITAAGAKGTRAGASRAETFGVTTSGVVGKRVGTSVPLAITITAAGTVGASGTGQAVRNETITIIATGAVAHSSGATRGETLAITATGRLGKTAGANRGLTFGVTDTGVVGKRAGVSRAQVITVLATGVKAAYAGASVGLNFAVTAAGQVATALTGTSTRPLTFTVVAAGAVYVNPPGTAVQGPQARVLLYAGNAEVLRGGGKATVISGPGQARSMEA